VKKVGKKVKKGKSAPKQYHLSALERGFLNDTCQQKLMFRSVSCLRSRQIFVLN